MKDLADIFVTFFRVGIMTFGGGYAMIPVVERELIRRKNWVSMEELMDYYTIAQITPGVIAVNLSTFTGAKRRGIPGGIIATLGFIFPGLTLMILVSIFIQRFAEYPVVRHAFAGIRLAVCTLILDTVLKLFKGVFKGRLSVAIFIIALGLSVFVSASPVLIILAAGLAGFFCKRPSKKAS
ncbi:MAG: chromate transporter [Treponema sp.]|jgi:chromate transporter|nr:chromate transporter [Treponema sp.]